MASSTILRISSLLVLLALGGCCTAPPYVTARLDVPAAPVVPVVRAAEFVRFDPGALPELEEATLAQHGVEPPFIAISVDVYRRLVVRDSLRKGHAEQLVAIIEEHNSKAE